MLIYYNKNNLNLNYLSPYVNISFFKDKISFYNYLYQTEVTLLLKPNLIERIIFYLESGIDTNSLLKELSKITKQQNELYEYLIRNFIIE